MSNIFKKIGIGLADAAKWVATAVKDVVGLASKVEKVLTAAKPLEQPFISGLATVIGDVETLLTDAGSAVTSEGLNIAADTKTYQDFLKLIDDFKTLAPVVEEALAILEGKPATTSATASTSSVS